MHASMHGNRPFRQSSRLPLAVMAALAFAFPGQGSQSVGMGRDLAASSPAAAGTFARADAALGESLSTLAWEGPAEELDRTEAAQPALLTASIAILEALRERWATAGLVAPLPAFAAGASAAIASPATITASTATICFSFVMVPSL